VLLFVTGGLKLQSLLRGQFDPAATLGPQAQAVVAEVEIALGVWLCSRRFVCGSWLTAMCFLFAGCAMNVYAIRNSVSSCGCFGSFKTDPAAVLVVDVLLLLVLLAFRPEMRLQRRLLEFSLVGFRVGFQRRIFKVLEARSANRKEDKGGDVP
jgi:hypothetical protein